MPALMEQIVNLLERVRTKDGQKLILKVISNLGTLPEHRLAFGRLEGFRKMLRLIADSDDELKRLILQAMRHFIDAQVMAPHSAFCMSHFAFHISHITGSLARST
jgi:hypothetical protein